jgi:hypothetical protein
LRNGFSFDGLSGVSQHIWRRRRNMKKKKKEHEEKEEGT